MHGRKNVPKSGPLILVSNHLSWADPALFVAYTPRTIRFMAKAELWENPVLNWLGRNHGEVLIHRGEADRAAIRAAEAVLADGDILGIMPEGTRSRTGGLIAGQPGAPFLAFRAKAPILPAAVWGTEQIHTAKDLLYRRKVHVRFGVPFELDPAYRRNMPEATNQMMHAIRALLPPRYHGIYAEGVDSPPLP